MASRSHAAHADAGLAAVVLPTAADAGASLDLEVTARAASVSATRRGSPEATFTGPEGNAFSPGTLSGDTAGPPLLGTACGAIPPRHRAVARR